MPLRNQLCLHSSANEDNSGHTTLFFGLSGTGKTTLSADPNRARTRDVEPALARSRARSCWSRARHSLRTALGDLIYLAGKLIGDDEHVWTDTGVFNVEGGCYAKCAGLSAESEPEIFGAGVTTLPTPWPPPPHPPSTPLRHHHLSPTLRLAPAVRFGAVVENVVMDSDSREVAYEDVSITENTRCACAPRDRTTSSPCRVGAPRVGCRARMGATVLGMSRQVSAQVHPERQAARAGLAPEQRGAAHVRRLRRAAARLAAEQGAGGLPPRRSLRCCGGPGRLRRLG